MDATRDEFWEPLPPDVAEWMGASDAKESLADAAEPIEIPVQRLRDRVRAMLRMAG